MRAREFAAALSAWPQCQWRPVIRSKKAYTTGKEAYHKVKKSLYYGRKRPVQRFKKRPILRSKKGLYYGQKGQKGPTLRSKEVVAELLNSRCPGTFPRQNAGPLTDALVFFLGGGGTCKGRISPNGSQIPLEATRILPLSIFSGLTPWWRFWW